jgi:uncharacterized protein with HEPN domain
MQRDVRAYLWDVCEAADKIADFIDGLDLKRYAETPVVHSAVERKFVVIGEALNQMAKLDRNWERRIPESAEIIAFRNVLVHGYAAVDHARVWRIARESLPGLRATAAALLDELGAS